ncbi:major facilitator superfamily domain-containing protein [Astrocystis sublimbata]|nr:major facilitator superfamily domain-containing protein [Astrocystis sublimbata]
MPETGRSVVGNGAVQPQGIWATWWQLLQRILGRRRLGAADASCCDLEGTEKHTRLRGEKDFESAVPNPGKKPNPRTDDPNFGKTGRGRFSAPNPVPSIRLLFHRDTALILWLCATPYAMWYCIQASIPQIYGPGYGFNDLEVGLSFLAGGGGVIFGGVIAGRLMDWSFKKTAIQAGFSPDKRKGIDISAFPIEKARSAASVPIMFVSMFAVGGFGWAVHTHSHPAIPLILQFFIGAKSTVLHQIYSALIVDIFPASPGTAGASNNICRCTLSAAIVAILHPVVSSIGYSWWFTLLALVEGLSGMVAVWTLRRKGWEWRKKRTANDDKGR